MDADVSRQRSGLTFNGGVSNFFLLHRKSTVKHETTTLSREVGHQSRSQNSNTWQLHRCKSQKMFLPFSFNDDQSTIISTAKMRNFEIISDKVKTCKICASETGSSIITKKKKKNKKKKKKKKKTDEAAPVNTMKAYRERRRTAPLILNLETR
jgi:hypothetical protein